MRTVNLRHEQGEPIGVVNLMIKIMSAMEIHLKVTGLVEESLQNRIFTVRLSGHLPSKRIRSVPRCTVVEPHLFLISSTDLGEVKFNFRRRRKAHRSKK